MVSMRRNVHRASPIPPGTLRLVRAYHYIPGLRKSDVVAHADTHRRGYISAIPFLRQALQILASDYPTLPSPHIRVPSRFHPL